MLALGLGCRLPEPAEHEACAPRPQPELPSIRHAEGFRLEAGPGWRRLVVERPYPDATEPATLLLLECGAAPPGAEPALQVPVSRLATTAAVQVAQLEALGALERLAAHAGVDALWSPAARELAAAGRLRDLGLEAPLEIEAVVAARPEVVLANPLSAADELATRLARVGIAWLPHAEWLEPIPLGRAEWLHVTAALVGREVEAAALIAEIEAGWQAQRELVAEIEPDRRPRVLTGLPWRGTWWVAGGASSTATLIEAGGGRYVFADRPGSANQPLDLEAVLDRAGDAEWWLAPGTATSSAEILAIEPRARAFAAFSAGRVIATDARTTASGGNDWWEGALVRPDQALADLIAVLHPGLVAGHRLRWLRVLGRAPTGDSAEGSP